MRLTNLQLKGYAVVRFKSNNIGYWMMHCHIDIHHGEGMAMIIQEGDGEEIERIVNFNDVNFCENKIERIEVKNSNLKSENQGSRGKFAHLYRIIIDPVYKYFSKFFSLII